MRCLELSAELPIKNLPALHFGGFELFGSDQKGGFHTEGDIIGAARVNKTADGIPLDQLWQDYNDLLNEINSHRSAIVSHLCYTTTAVADAVPGGIDEAHFEEASEFGVPKAVQAGNYTVNAYDFRDYDLATRFTWRFLRDANRQQVDHVTTSIVEANNRNVTRQILKRLFDPTQRNSPENQPVRGLWNGSDGFAPLPYLGREFPENTSHYLATQNATLDSQDIEDAVRMLTQKGYGRRAGSRILVFANSAETDKIATWKSGEESRAGGPVATFDFIPSADAPPYLTTKTIVGSPAPADLDGLRVIGSYGDSWIIPTEILPAGYVAVVASAGANSPHNAVGFRIHPDTSYQGLKLIPGNTGPYPLQDAFFTNAFGTGVRNRGAAVCIQITAGSTYTAPTWPGAA